MIPAELAPEIPRQLAIDIDAAEEDRLTAYQDTLGNWTCGRGHLLPPAAPGRSWEGFSVPQSTSDRWFNGDLFSAIRIAQRWPEFQSCDTEARQNALYEIAFNMPGKWHEFVKARAAIQAKDWQVAHDELLNSAWAHQVQPHGLDKPGRATRIAGQFLKGEYEPV